MTDNKKPVITQAAVDSLNAENGGAIVSKITKAEKIYVNSVLQGCIQEWLDNPPVTTYDALNEAWRAKFDQLEKETQRLLDPTPKKPRKPKSPAAQELEHLTRSQTASAYTVIAVPDGLQVGKDAITKRSRR